MGLHIRLLFLSSRALQNLTILRKEVDVYCLKEVRGISGFRRNTDEICTLLGYYAASKGNLLPTFRDKKSKKNTTSWTS
jgi:hypothetical protein